MGVNSCSAAISITQMVTLSMPIAQNQILIVILSSVPGMRLNSSTVLILIFVLTHMMLLE